jgi:hypothetical protein
LLSAAPASAEDGNKPAIATAETSYQGARVLRKGIEVEGGQSAPGIYKGDEEEGADIERYSYWQGDTLFLGAYNQETGNSVDAVAEFYWFESSIPKSSDFYVMVIKAKTSPNALNGWKLRQEEDWWTGFWDGNKPCQLVDVNMADMGSAGSIRWDWSVPFQNYGWEPIGSIEVAQSYSVGFDGDAQASGNPLGAFKEGGFLKDITKNANIQAKGQFNKSFSVSSQYTVTLHKWQMFVQGGATHMTWNLVVAPEGSISDDSAYHEYYVVVQAPEGTTAKIDSIDIAASFHKPVSFWFDDWDSLSAGAVSISFTPPIDVECYFDTKAPQGYCAKEGACGSTKPVCMNGKWECPTPDYYEDEETTCDGFDNDCDGKTDENLAEPCETECGFGEAKCWNGIWSECSAPKPKAEICDGKDNDCDGEIDNASDCMETPEEPEEPEEPEAECEKGDKAPKGFCGTEGVCADAAVECVDGEWRCEKPADIESEETLCDNLDNDCDGKTDENLTKMCDTACGKGTITCDNGVWSACQPPPPTQEVCGDGIDNDCDGVKDNCEADDEGDDDEQGEEGPYVDPLPGDQGSNPATPPTSETPAAAAPQPAAGCNSSGNSGGFGALMAGTLVALLAARPRRRRPVPFAR